ncbi:alpha/beta hydrolase [Salinibacterium sp. NYA9b]
MAANLPTILVLPGGGYSRLAPHEGEPVAAWLRSIGWNARVVEYPVSTKHPAPLLAIQSEIAKERALGAPLVGVLGFSAGGHLAGHAAVAPVAKPEERPDFAVLGYPVVSMMTPTHAGSREELIGLDANDYLREDTSLELLVTPATPPMFIWHTAADEPVPVAEHSYPLAAALAAAGVRHELHVFADGKHGLGLAEGTPAEAWQALCEIWLSSLR